MCGRFTFRTRLNLALSQFAAELGEIDYSLGEPSPRYNVAPTQDVFAVRRGGSMPELVALRWGFIPSWSKDGKMPTINARAETVAEKPMFRSAYRKRRCLVLADGYYEWLREGKAKLPHLYEVDGGKPFAFAGLWETWQGMETVATLTTEANELAAVVHDRMPVILDPADYDGWLAGEQIPLLPFPSDRMTVRQVSQTVNNARNEGPQCIAVADE